MAKNGKNHSDIAIAEIRKDIEHIKEVVLRIDKSIDELCKISENNKECIIKHDGVIGQVKNNTATQWWFIAALSLIIIGAILEHIFGSK